MRTYRLVVAAMVALGAAVPACAQSESAPPRTIVLIDSAGKVAARPLNDTIMLITVSPGVVAPAFVRPIFDADERAASGLATWAGGGSVLFTSQDCSTGAYIPTLGTAGLRSTSQVETPEGTMLYVGAIGAPVTAVVHSILYGSGCSPVTVRQNGLVPVVAAINLTTTYSPPLSFQ